MDAMEFILSEDRQGLCRFESNERLIVLKFSLIVKPAKLTPFLKITSDIDHLCDVV